MDKERELDRGGGRDGNRKYQMERRWRERVLGETTRMGVGRNGTYQNLRVSLAMGIQSLSQTSPVTRQHFQWRD